MSAKKDNSSERVAEPHRQDRGKSAQASERKRKDARKKMTEFEQMNGAESAYFRKA